MKHGKQLSFLSLFMITIIIVNGVLLCYSHSSVLRTTHLQVNVKLLPMAQNDNNVPFSTLNNEFVFWFATNNTTTLYFSQGESVLTITTISAQYDTIIAETTIAQQETNTPFTINKLTALSHVMINNTTIIEERVFYLKYSSAPQSFEKLVQATYETYKNAVLSFETTKNSYVITYPPFGPQTILQTTIATNNTTIIEYTQYLTSNAGTLQYTVSMTLGGKEYYKTLSMNISKPFPMYGTIIIKSNPYSTMITGFMNALVNGTYLYFHIHGTNIFTEIVTLDGTVITYEYSPGIPGTYTISGYTFGNGTIKWNWSDGAHETIILPSNALMNNTILVIQNHVPLTILFDTSIISLTADTILTGTNTIIVPTIQNGLYARVALTGTPTTIILPKGVPAFLLLPNTKTSWRAQYSNFTLLIHGTLVEKNTLLMSSIPVPNFYNAENVYEFVTSITDAFSNLTTYTIRQLVINASLPHDETSIQPGTFFFVNQNGDTLRMTMINNGLPTIIYAYTFMPQRNKIIETYNYSKTIVVTTTMIMPLSTTITMYYNTPMSLTITLTSTTTMNVPQTQTLRFLYVITTTFLKTTLLKPQTFSAIQQYVASNQNTTTIVNNYTSPLETIAYASITCTLIIHERLIIVPAAQTLSSTSTNGGVLYFDGLTVSSTAPQNVKKAAINIITIVFFIIIALITIFLIRAILCIARADDDDDRKKCFIKLALVIAAYIVIFVLPRVLDWSVGL